MDLIRQAVERQRRPADDGQLGHFGREVALVRAADEIADGAERGDDLGGGGKQRDDAGHV